MGRYALSGLLSRVTKEYAMEYIRQYQAQRDQYWPEVERHFGDLSPDLYHQSLPLRHSLTRAYSDNGEFEGILRRPYDHPLLYLHFWLLDDWCYPAGEARDSFDKHVFLAMVFTFAAAFTHDGILDPDTSFDSHYRSIERAFDQTAADHLAHVFPESSPFWSYYHSLKEESMRAASAFSERIQQVAPFTDEDMRQMGRRLAFGKISVAAAAVQAGRVDLLPHLFLMLDQLNIVLQAVQDIANIQRDVGRGHYTYPIVRTMQAAGLELSDTVAPERILAAVLLTGFVANIGQECLIHLERCRTLAQELKLPSFERYVTALEEWIGQLGQLFSLKPVAATDGTDTDWQWAKTFFAPYRDSLSQSTQMAEGYLLADRTFRESWEVQRQGTANLSGTAKAFPVGFIVEVLCQYRDDMAEQVDMIFEILGETGFRYYDNLPTDPDADELGVGLRLYRYSAQKEAHRELLKIPLRWMEDNILPSGRIPLYFSRHDRAVAAHRPSIVLWGDHCMVVEANLLRGLIDYDRDRYSDIIERAAFNWLDDTLRSGLGANYYYPPHCAIWMALEFLWRLSHPVISPALKDKVRRVSEMLIQRLEVETWRETHSPQQAAFLTLICLRDPSGELAHRFFDRRWITLLLKRQRGDGGWPSEPFYVCPLRSFDMITWYSSQTITTAICYHALKTYLRFAQQKAD
jgi:hypothetical protein